MEMWCSLLLLFRGAMLIHSEPLIGLTLSSPNSEAIKKAIDIYNARRNTSFLFSLLTTDPQYQQFGVPDGIKLHFMIKETNCQNTKQQSLEQCAYKENGVVKNCTLTSRKRDIKVSCNTLTSLNPPLKENQLENKVKENNISAPQQEAPRDLIIQVRTNVSSNRIRQKSTKVHMNSMSCLSCIFGMTGNAGK
ncbi:cathelicidin-6-like [Xenopus laevis]|uniref:Uncharacterized protein n=2 Tax=Xenopus laevis TaxID=8355 RepID=A0A974HEV0_XENLA|nr:cathelicidin-6-like [Xenopus laevis]OCT75380.1 hypothetical protein XELAEV_18030559mg [Xenopus laevis]